MRQNTFEKNKLGKYIIEQVIEFELRGPGPLGHRPSQEIRGYSPN